MGFGVWGGGVQPTSIFEFNAAVIHGAVDPRVAGRVARASWSADPNTILRRMMLSAASAIPTASIVTFSSSSGRV